MHGSERVVNLGRVGPGGHVVWGAVLAVPVAGAFVMWGWVSWLEAVGFVLVASGSTLLPDLDLVQSRAAGVFDGKPVQRGDDWLPSIRFGSRTVVKYTLVPLFGGHRWRSHDPLFGPWFFGLATLALVWWPVTSGAVVGVVAAMVLVAADAVGLVRSNGLFRYAVALAVWWSVVATGFAPGWWMAAAVGFGALFHLPGDVASPLPIPGQTWFSWRKTKDW